MWERMAGAEGEEAPQSLQIKVVGGKRSPSKREVVLQVAVVAEQRGQSLTSESDADLPSSDA